jgi:hypothetical protein
MQDRYVPDLGDYSKFGVIRALARPGAADGLRVGLVWYRVDLGEQNADGRHVGYLDLDGAARERYRAPDPDVYDRMRAIRRAGLRSVTAYRLREVAGPAGRVRHAEDLLDLDGLPTPAARAAARAAWLDRALAVVDDAELVVLDPDNGLEVASVSPTSRRGVKFATLAECAAFSARGRRSLVVYQHAHRGGPVARQADAALERLAARLEVQRARCFALRFHRGTSRLYLVVPGSGNAAVLRRRAEAMVTGPWGRLGHFSLVP